MSSSTFVLAATVAAGLFASTATAAFNAAASNNVAMYWGQGNAQIPLSQVCNDASIDIVNIAFVNQFPLKVGDYPSTNFANACGDATFTKPDGTKSGLLSSCPSIGPGIKECQANGKKVLLSIGGGYPINYTLPSPAVAEYFAEFLWGAFGPSTAAWVNAGKPRPFGDASVDGFDLDIEALINPAPFPDYLFANYDKFVARLKNGLFPSGPGPYYISAAPQCNVPDVRLASAISKSHFDFIFTQFYNTPECSTRAGYNGLSTATTTFTFTKWVDWLKANSLNKNVKLYLGMPAGVDGAPNDTPATLTPTEANALLKFYKNKHADIFGGAMLWEATVSAKNTKCQKGYSSWIKDILLGKFTNEVCPSSSSTIASSTSSRISSTSSSASATPTATKPTPDGTCGGTTGYTCIGYVLGECCSQWGYCGSTTDHCGPFIDCPKLNKQPVIVGVKLCV
ncbi:carbohydrate-binding module family 18 protein [Melanomma pulvis-pyrius CBS 109.77]|uniref:chitinase n=1 Tax=Melanomma pulvis-pyrius CBS 109.77 TaxID=1314802 RepID=A0A6A6X4I8_9PLEO|nr:carbohydrate-binding module family 18 protein [Melanomma pulvis-pyrius CBS 109.77]